MGSSATRQRKRRALRKKWRAMGWSEERIADAIERYEFEHLVRVHGLDEARQIVYDRQPDQPDDRRYRPKRTDPTLTGAARATGQTAAAVRRGRTVTKWQHEREDRSARSDEERDCGVAVPDGDFSAGAGVFVDGCAGVGVGGVAVAHDVDRSVHGEPVVLDQFEQVGEDHGAAVGHPGNVHQVGQ